MALQLWQVTRLAAFMSELTDAIRNGNQFRVEYRYPESGQWQTKNPNTAWSLTNEYRVVIESRVVYINRYDGGNYVYDTLNDTITCRADGCIETIKFIEKEVVWKSIQDAKKD